MLDSDLVFGLHKLYGRTLILILLPSLLSLSLSTKKHITLQHTGYLLCSLLLLNLLALLSNISLDLLHRVIVD